MKSQVLHTVWCNITGEATGEIWTWSLLGVKGLSPQKNGNTITHIIIVPFPPVVESNVPVSAKPEKEQTRGEYQAHILPTCNTFVVKLVLHVGSKSAACSPQQISAVTCPKGNSGKKFLASFDQWQNSFRQVDLKCWPRSNIFNCLVIL